MISLCFAMLDNEEDEKRFNEFYEKYKQLVFHVCNDILGDSGLAEDAVSETFLKFAGMFYKVKDINALTTRHYVVIIAKHKALKMYNKHKNKSIQDSFDDVDEADVPMEIDFEDKAISRLDCKDIYKRVLLSLPRKYYEVMYMTVVLQLTAKEIAQSLDLDVKTVYKRIERARQMIKEKIERI